MRLLAAIQAEVTNDPVKQLRILVVEDDVLVGSLLREMLSDMGHHVVAVVGTQAGAIEAAARHEPDLILLDEHLGSGYGSFAIAEILSRRTVPYILMSGASSPAMASAVASLKKPFFEADLRQAIATALVAVSPV